MNTFDSFIRFFPLADSGVERPVDLNLPDEAYPVMPVVSGDSLRWLVQRSDCGAEHPERLGIGIRAVGNTGPGQLCGRLRQQAGATYHEFRLRIDAVPEGYRQFALMTGDQNIMGTFRGEALSMTDYVRAIAEHYEGFEFAATDVDVMGREVRVRVYPNDRFSLHGEPVRVGIGTVRERNENSPSLISIPKLYQTLPAEDSYTVDVATDIQRGNVFVLDSVSYTAIGTERAADILRALGVVNSRIARTGGANVIAYAQPGNQTVANTNRPTLQLLYDSSAGGNDLYLATVGVDVQPGNVYQVTAPGMVTRTVTATATDTKATVEAQFNTLSGKLAIPAGAVPVVSAVAGSQVLPNTNNPRLTLTDKVAKPVRTVDVYTVYVGSSVVMGNGFSLSVGGDTVDVVAGADDTALSIATQLGRVTNPFTVEVTPGVPVVAIARKGPLYHEPNDVAPITLLSYRTVGMGLPLVALAEIPTLAVGRYELVLRRGVTVLAVSNRLEVRADGKDTEIVGFGVERPMSVMGVGYAEDGLMQRLRLPIHVDVPKRRQGEALYMDLDSNTVRGRTSADEVHMLTTRMQPTAFHRNLYMALKHPVLRIGRKFYRQEGEYSETSPQGRSRKRQATAELVGLNRREYRPTFDSVSDSLSGYYATIGRMTGLHGLYVAVKRLSFTEQIETGQPIQAADYEILIRCGPDALRLAIGQDGQRIATVLLVPGKLNRTGLVRLGPGVIDLIAEVTTEQVTETTLDLYNPQDAEVVATEPETAPRGGDFNEDFTADFNQ